MTNQAPPGIQYLPQDQIFIEAARAVRNRECRIKANRAIEQLGSWLKAHDLPDHTDNYAHKKDVTLETRLKRAKNLLLELHSHLTEPYQLEISQVLKYIADGKYDPLHSNEFGVIHFQMNPRPAEFDPEDVVEQVLEIAERVWQLEEGDDDDDNQTGSSRPMPR